MAGAAHCDELNYDRLIDPDTVVDRLRQSLVAGDLECHCKDLAQGILDRVDADTERLARVAGLEDARRMKAAIVRVISLLNELDEISAQEPDRSAFVEVADLFRDISDFATLGAVSARRAAGKRNME